MNPKIFSLVLVAALFAAALLLLGCTFSNQHGTFRFEPTPEMLERAGIKIHPVNRDKR
jgi:hypothetical protein